MKFGGLLIFFSITVFAQSCGDSANFAGGARRANKPSLDATPASETPPSESSKDPNGEAIPGEIGPGGEPIGQDCPETMQEVLVLDLKSGWWAGDAGDFFTTLLAGITEPCGDSFRFEFHHVLETSNTYQVFPNGTLKAGSILDVEQLALKKDWSGYSQIWVLSGSQADTMDMRVSNPVFAGIVGKIKAAKVPLFLGSGNGNLTHANALMAGLGYATRFATNLPEGPVVDATEKFTIVSRMTMGKELTNHELFTRGIQAIADAVQSDDLFGGGVLMQSDYLQCGADFSSVAKNVGGMAAIAISMSEGSKVVLDSGLQRYYSIKDSGGKDTLTFLQNIAVFLSKK